MDESCATFVYAYCQSDTTEILSSTTTFSLYLILIFAGSRGNLEELHSLFAGEESFDKFTDDIVKQFMKEEELRAHHQVQYLP